MKQEKSPSWEACPQGNVLSRLRKCNSHPRVWVLHPTGEGKLGISPDPGLSDARSSVRRMLSFRWRPPSSGPLAAILALHTESVNPSTEGLSLAATVDKT